MNRKCSTCGEVKPLDKYYDAYKYVNGWPVVMGKRKQCKRCCINAKKKRTEKASIYVNRDPICDPVIRDLMNAWPRLDRENDV